MAQSYDNISLQLERISAEITKLESRLSTHEHRVGEIQAPPLWELQPSYQPLHERPISSSYNARQNDYDPPPWPDPDPPYNPTASDFQGSSQQGHRQPAYFGSVPPPLYQPEWFPLPQSYQSDRAELFDQSWCSQTGNQPWQTEYRATDRCIDELRSMPFHKPERPYEPAPTHGPGPYYTLSGQHDRPWSYHLDRPSLPPLPIIKSSSCWGPPGQRDHFGPPQFDLHQLSYHRKQEYIISEPYAAHDTAVLPQSFYGGYTNAQSEYQQPDKAAQTVDQFSLQALPTHPWDPPCSNNQQQLVQVSPPTCGEPDTSPPPHATPLYTAAQQPCLPYQPPPQTGWDSSSRAYGLRVGEMRQHPTSEPEMHPNPYHGYSSPPPAPMPEPSHCYPSLMPEPDDPHSHYQSSEELYPPVSNGEGDLSTFFNYSADDYLSYADSWQPEDRPSHSLPLPDQTLHPPSWLPSNYQPDAVVVPVLLKEAQYLRGEKVVGVIVASPHKEVRTAKSMVNLIELFATFATDVICIVALGRKYGDGEEFTKVTEELGNELDVFLGCFIEGKFVPWLCWIKFVNGISRIARRVARNINEFLEFRVREHIGERKEGKKDFVDVLLELLRDARCGFVLGDISIKALILDMFVAGSDTTFTLIEWTLSELRQHKRAKNEFFFMVDVLTLLQLCASSEHLHAFDPGGSTSPKLMLLTLVVASWFPP